MNKPMTRRTPLRICPISRVGLTLLELLVALSLLSLLVAGTGGWLVSMATLQRSLSISSAARMPLDDAAELLRRDIESSWGGSNEPGGLGAAGVLCRSGGGLFELDCITANSPSTAPALKPFGPGGGYPAWQYARWRWTESVGTLTRSVRFRDTGAWTTRTVLTGVTGITSRVLEEPDPITPVSGAAPDGARSVSEPRRAGGGGGRPRGSLIEFRITRGGQASTSFIAEVRP